MLKRLAICADDYALNAATTAGILELLAMARLSATSCMTTAPRWPQDGPRLRNGNWPVDVGLHLTLTEPFAQPCYPLGQLMVRSSLRLLPRRIIAGAIRLQLDRFEDVMGRPPDFIDGHHHVHAAPVIRDLLALEVTRRYPDNRPYVRHIAPLSAVSGSPRKGRILRCWTAGFARMTRQLQWPGNRELAGIYSLRDGTDFAALFERWLASLPDGGMIFCHPASGTAGDDDSIAATRTREFAYLRSDACVRVLAGSGVTIARLRDFAEPGNSGLIELI